MQSRYSKRSLIGIRISAIPFFLTVLFGVSSFAFAGGTDSLPAIKAPGEERIHRTLALLKPRIEEVLRECSSDPVIEIKGSRLTAKCDVKKFEMPPSEQKKGLARKGWSESLEGVIPDAKGLVLVVSLLPGNKSIIQKATGSFQEKYWNLFRQDYPIKNKRKHLWVEIFSGKETSNQVLEKLKEIFSKES